MIRDIVFLLVGWLPSPINLIVLGVLSFMIIWGVLHLIKLAWDLLPFT